VSNANEFELVVRYEQRKSHLLTTTKLDNWCHRFQRYNCTNFK